MIKARASGSKVYLYFMKKGRQARHRILRNSCDSQASVVTRTLSEAECSKNSWLKIALSGVKNR